MSNRINVTKTHLPPLEDYEALLKEVWNSGQLTNYGEKSNLLQEKLRERLGAKHLLLVNNGTIALQLAIKALDLKGEIITTPFSYVATVSSIVWEGCEPVFVDINEVDFCIHASKIEAAITEKTCAILATHVYGNPCAVQEIQEIADRHGLKVIYDAAHAFDVKLNGESILNHGDISTLSFHATKVFHMGEGGAVVTNDDELAHRLWYLGNFGHNGPEAFHGLGVNAKVSEIHAALGLCVLPQMPTIIGNRRKTVELYENHFKGIDSLYRIPMNPDVEGNHAYYPVVFRSEEAMLKVRNALNAEEIYPRRYFFPSLNHLPYLKKQVEMPIADSVSKRVLCLPLSSDHNKDDIDRISKLIIENL
jgi:dTDP-4-amino-4,6-dideoxygalactose transaminase